MCLGLLYPSNYHTISAQDHIFKVDFGKFLLQFGTRKQRHPSALFPKISKFWSKIEAKPASRLQFPIFAHPLGVLLRFGQVHVAAGVNVHIGRVAI